MEALGVLIAIGLLLALLAAPVMGIVALVKIGDLRRRVRELEARLAVGPRAEPRAPAAESAAAARAATGSHGPAPSPESAPVPTATETPPAPPDPPAEVASTSEPARPATAPPESPVPPSRTPIAATPRRPRFTEQQIMVLGMAVVGGLAFLVAAGFFLRYVIEQGMLGPSARVALGALAGVALVVGAERLRVRHRVLGETLGGTGIATLFVALWAGERLYSILPFALAASCAAFVAVAAAVLAIRWNSRLVAWLGLFGADGVLLAFAGADDLGAVGLVWVLLVAVGVGEVVRRTGWMDLLVAALLGSVILEARGLPDGRTEAWIWAGLVLAIHLALLARTRIWRTERPRSAAGLGAGISIAVVIFVGAAIVGQAREAFLPVAALLVAMTLVTRRSVRDPDGRIQGATLAILGAGSSILFATALLDTTSPFGLAESQLLSGLGVGLIAAAGLSAALRRARVAEGPGDAANDAPAALPLVLAGAFTWLSLAGLQLAVHHHLAGTTGAALVPLVHAALATALLVALRRRMDPFELPLRGDDRSFLVVAALALVFWTAILPVQLDHQHLTAALALEAVALFALGRRFGAPALGRAAAIALAWSFLRLLGDLPRLDGNDLGALPFLNWRSYAFGLPAVAALGIASRLGSRKVSGAAATGDGWVGLGRAWRAVFGPAGLLAIFVGLNFEVDAWFLSNGFLGSRLHAALPELTRSLTWLVFGFILLARGLSSRARALRGAGLFVLVLTVFKVFLVDVSSLANLFRVASLVALSIVLFAGAFLYSRLVAREDLDDPTPDGSPPEEAAPPAPNGETP